MGMSIRIGFDGASSYVRVVRLTYERPSTEWRPGTIEDDWRRYTREEGYYRVDCVVVRVSVGVGATQLGLVEHNSRGWHLYTRQIVDARGHTTNWEDVRATHVDARDRGRRRIDATRGGQSKDRRNVGLEVYSRSGGISLGSVLSSSCSLLRSSLRVAWWPRSTSRIASWSSRIR